MRRGLGIVCLLLSAVFVVVAAGVPRAAEEAVASSGSGEAAAVHARATKEAVLPVPNAIDTFLPLARTGAESPVRRTALAAPVYDTNISNLPEFICIASGNQLCLPSVPLQASVEQPGASSNAAQTPVPAIEAGPVRIEAGYAEVRADGTGARGLATEGGLTVASPGGTPEVVAALAGALAVADPTWEPELTDAVLATSGGSASSELSVGDGGIRVTSVSELSGVRLAHGLIQIGSLRSEAVGVAGESRRTGGGPEITEVRVGPFDAAVGPDGVRITDRSLADGVRAGLNEALAALDELVRIRAGELETEPRPDGVDVRSVALRVDYRRQVVPNTGAESVTLELGTATATTAWSRTTFDDPTGTVEQPPAAGGVTDVRGGTVGTSPSGGEPRLDGQRITALDEPEVASSRSPLPGLPDFPAPMIVLVVLAAMTGAAGLALLTGWQVAEE